MVKENTQKQEVAVILCRVSSLEQAEGYSLDAQKAKLMAYCERKNLKIAEVFSFSESSTRGERKEFKKVIKYIKSHPQRIALVCDKVDRLQRSYNEVPVLDALRLSGKLSLHFISEDMILDENANSSQLFSYNMLVGHAKFYADTISDNVKRSHVQMRKEGKCLSSAPIGYKNIRHENGRADIIIDEEVAPFVIKLFELYSTGMYSYDMLLEKTIEWGWKNKKSGKPYTRNIIEHILKNKFYYGVIEPKSKKHQEYEHVYPRLIKYDLYKQCEDVRLGRRSQHNSKKKQEFLFSGLIKCANCGCTITPEIKKGKYVYLRPNSKQGCNCKQINENVANNLVETVLKAFSIPTEILSKYISKLQKHYDKEHSVELTQKKLLEQSLTQINNKMDRLLDVYLENDLSKEEYEVKKKRLYDEKLDAENRLANFTAESDEIEITLELMLQVVSQVFNLYMSSGIETKRQILNLVFPNLLLNGSNLSYTIRKPLEEFFKKAICLKWWAL